MVPVSESHLLMDDGIYLEAQYSVDFSENGAHFGDVYDGGFGDFNGEFQAPTSEFQVLTVHTNLLSTTKFCRSILNTGTGQNQGFPQCFLSAFVLHEFGSSIKSLCRSGDSFTF